MSRPIKFRFWRDGKMHFAHQLNAYPGNDFAGEDEILMQFTGLHDKDGKDIYEGDIIKMPGWSYLVEVMFYEHRARFCCQLHEGRNDFIPINSEVRGNIYENPELLK